MNKGDKQMNHPIIWGKNTGPGPPCPPGGLTIPSGLVVNHCHSRTPGKEEVTG